MVKKKKRSTKKTSKKKSSEEVDNKINSFSKEFEEIEKSIRRIRRRLFL
ncbi:MAG: hypothetical protein ABIG89_00360 [Candidatus Woesearchaeota archaeon]